MRISKLAFSCLSVMLLSNLMAVDQKKKEPSCPKFLGSCPCFPVGGDVALSLDSFRSLPEGSWAGNFGAFSSLNLAIGIPNEKYGFGVQVGGSYGLYDWEGRGSNASGNTKAFQQQAFLTGGLFRMTPGCSGFNAGIVYDVMFNKRLGVFAVNPTFGQLRGQLGYLIKGGNEVGVWSTINTCVAQREADEIPVKFRAVSQVNLFWSHYFKNKAQMQLWAGTPYRRGLMYTSGRAGRYIFGASFKAPLTTSLSVVGHGSYMAAASGPAFQESKNYAANVSFGLNYSFGGCKSGQRPYLPLADNSNFLVDTNLNQ